MSDRLNVLKALRNILHVLQTNPQSYRNFGIYWWPVKALLRRQFGREQLYLLGDYVDEDGAARVPEAGLEETLRAALAEYGHNARYNLGRPTVFDADGSPYYIHDQDAGPAS